MTPRTIYIYGNLDFMGKSAATKRMLYYAKALANQDNAVYLVSCSSNKFTQEDFVEVAPKIFILEKKKLTYSLFSSLSFLRHLYRFSNDKAGEKVFLIYPQSWFNLELLTVLYFILVKKRNVFYELNEVKKYSPAFHEPQSIKKIKYAIKTIVFKSKFIIMDSLMRFYDGLVCISTSIETYGKKYNKNTIYIPILTNPKIEPELSSTVYARRNTVNIGFSGSIVPSKENLFQFIDVVLRVHDSGRKVTFNLCGTGSKKDLKRLAEKEGETIVYHGNLDENELSSFLLQQDILVLPRGFTLQNKYGFSTKLSDYLNHKKVILCTDISDNSLYIKNGLNGFVVEPDDMQMMHERLVYIIENFSTIKDSIIENAFQTSREKFDYRLYEKSLQLFLNQRPS
ncbi:glycosyltransferase [Maribacter sp. 2308TA10-17]|uniref:glycosyltransferase n=1 Tax=Maribacter sp. 2308TA10-17 TaxID=3386276 RepID=UPI0039BC36CE